MPTQWADEHGIAVDRDGDVPVGVQLTWALRNAIHLGRLSPGDRLPPLRLLADELGVNPNTLRATYARLEAEGLIDTRHGTGTFITADAAGEDLGQLVADTTRAAADAGVDPRALAAALYVGVGRDEDETAAARRRLHQEIAALERIVALMKPPPPPPAKRARQGPRVLDLAELERVRDELVARISAGDRPADGADGAETEAAARERGRIRRRTGLGPVADGT